jgi:hypothetical protein
VTLLSNNPDFVCSVSTQDLDLSLRMCLSEHAEAIHDKSKALKSAFEASTCLPQTMVVESRVRSNPASVTSFIDKLGYLTRDVEAHGLSLREDQQSIVPTAAHILLEAVILARRFDSPKLMQVRT